MATPLPPPSIAQAADVLMTRPVLMDNPLNSDLCRIIGYVKNVIANGNDYESIYHIVDIYLKWLYTKLQPKVFGMHIDEQQRIERIRRYYQEAFGLVRPIINVLSIDITPKNPEKFELFLSRFREEADDISDPVVRRAWLRSRAAASYMRWERAQPTHSPQ